MQLRPTALPEDIKLTVAMCDADANTNTQWTVATLTQWVSECSSERVRVHKHWLHQRKGETARHASHSRKRVTPLVYQLPPLLVSSARPNAACCVRMCAKCVHHHAASSSHNVSVST